jgi:hypothetical protein
VQIEDRYKRVALPLDCPRKGDLAAIIKDHHRTETGMTVVVVNDPHKAEQYCSECGQAINEYFVEVECKDWPKAGGPYFYPIKWLRRVLPV